MALTSRSGRIARDGQGLAAQLERLEASGTPFETLPCDVGHWQEALAMLHGMRTAASTSQGVLHAAGVLRDGLLKGMTRSAFQLVASPKAFGAWHVHCASSLTPLEALLSYSSIASAFGNVGQANYAAGNASLDSFALARSASGLAAGSLQLPLVKDAGMGAAHLDAKQMTYRGMNAMALDQYAACVAMQLATTRGAFGCGAHVPLAAQGLLQNVPSATQPLFVELAGAKPSVAQVAAASVTTVGPTVTSPLGTQLLAMVPSKREGHVEGLIVAAVSDLAGSEEISATTPLMDAGIDSLAATELAGRLRDASGVEITATAMFDHPTPRALASHMVEQLVGTQVAAPRASAQGTAAAAAQLSVQAVTASWPAGCATSSRVSMLMSASGDAVGTVPAARWSLAGHEDKLSDAQASAARYGSFVSGADRFDNRAFSIAPAEARTMDPQQRALLETGYVALHGSGLRSDRLLGGSVGYFLGIERPDWALKAALTPDVKVTAYTVTADTISIACGRVSFALGLHGPCMAIDTACASGLTAMHSAGLAVRGGECAVGLTSAVTLKVAPQPTLAAASVGMLSLDGRCKTLDARANGYARAEGVGALAVGASAAAAPGTALGGSAVRQDGRSASLTAPNGSAQRLVVLGALGQAACTAQSVDGVELHGTGTPLGDPTELGALVGVFRAGRSAPLAIGAAKGNVGHSEPVSGLLGLAKVVLQQRSLAWRGNAQLRVANPLVAERLGAQSAAYALPTQSAEAATGARRTGLSAFGYSGTISHAVLDVPPASTASLRVAAAHMAPSRFVHTRFSWVSRQPPRPRLGELSVTDGDVKWEHTPDKGELAFLRSHRVGLVSLLPGTCYIEFARNVAVAAHGPVPYTLDRIAFEVSLRPRRLAPTPLVAAHMLPPLPSSNIHQLTDACPSCRRRSSSWTKTWPSWVRLSCAFRSSAPPAHFVSHLSLRKASLPTTRPWRCSCAQQVHLLL